MNILEQLKGALPIIKVILYFLVTYWWVYLPVVLIAGTYSIYKTYTRTRYLMGLKWTMLEVKPPPDVQKSPKIAENIFAGIHGIYKGGTGSKEMFFEGKVPDWFSFEIVGDSGEMKFYIRTLESLRNLVEVVIFSQYPDAEISVVDDYVDRLPRYLPDSEHDLFGTELIFSKEDAYPIKTYPSFEEEGGAKETEFKRTDPLAPLAEIMSALGPGEHIWLQLLARPTGGDWIKSAQTVIDKIMGKEPPAPKRDIFGLGVDLVESFFTTPGVPEKKEKAEPSVGKLTPGQKYVLEQIENKLSKLGFKAGYRFLYIGRKDSFNASRIPTVTGMFKQMYANNLNSFTPNKATMTGDKGWFSWFFPSSKGFFADDRALKKKKRLYRKYRMRDFVDKNVILNTEELATLFHLPGINVRAPAFPRVEAKKGQPPMGLPIRGFSGGEVRQPVEPPPGLPTK